MDSRRIDLTNNTFGIEKRQDILDKIALDGTYLPESVQYDDIDKGVLDFVKDEVDLSVDKVDSEGVVIDTKVPVFFMTIQKWTEFTRTWGSSDEYKDVQLPFITVVRNPDVQQGTNQNQYWNIPGHRAWTYYKVPTFNNGRVGMDLYKVPQPTSVDMTFQVRFFSNRMTELNKLHTIIQKKFNSLQHYVYIKGHPMPLVLESVTDESKTDDMDGRKYYVQTFEIKCLGHILDDKDFQITPAIDRTKLSVTTGDSTNMGTAKYTKKHNPINNTINYGFQFKSSDYPSLKIKMNENTAFTTEVDSYNIFSTKYLVNGTEAFLPFNIKRNDELEVRTEKLSEYGSFLELSGIVNTLNKVSIIKPENNYNFPSNPNIYIEVAFLGVEVTKTEFFKNNMLIKRLESKPLDGFVWMNVPDGIYTLVVKSYNEDNLIAVSDPIDIVVGEISTASNFILTDEYRLYTDL